MRKFPFFFFALAVLFASDASAQTYTYRLENFDLREGVRVEQEAPQPHVKPAQTKRQRVRLTSKVSTPAAKHDASLSSESLQTNPTETARSMSVSRSLDGYSTGNAFVDSMIVESSLRNGVDPLLIYAVMHQESTFKQRALSPKGARGLMQLMPATARRFGVRNIFDPRENIEGGAKYMRWLLNHFDGDVRLALAGYNAGEGAVMKYGWRVPPYNETQNYVRRILGRYSLMRDPQTARRAAKVTPSQIAAIHVTEKHGVTYEQSVYVVRLPDGKLRLVSQ